MSRWRSIPFPLPLSIHREPMPSPLFTLHQTMQVATTSFAQAGGPCFCLLCLPFDYRRRKRRRPLIRKQASKTGQQLHPSTCTNRKRLLARNGPAIPICFRCCSAQMFQLSLVSTYSSSFFIIQVGCCCCPASSLALVVDQLVAVGELC